ncbi:MAG: polymorphic toxin-type HINT domain-containing protein [Actinomycetota bacterium]|nr:polymorphic toxin-type HINT domain-containing protein [Actinomycetota bacterium]MDQ2956048.1 polymorphic toxin-type HINT domain-containing protein [Actinomycetota bacterium]
MTGAWLKVGSTGLAVAQAKSAGSTGTVSKVEVEVLDPATAAKAGLSGLVLRLTRLDAVGVAAAVGTAAPVAVQIPTSVLGGLFGADYAARVQWVQLPATATTATMSSGKVRPVPVASARQAAGSAVLTPSVTSNAILLAAAGSPVSSTGTGTWAATSLKTSASWQVSTQSGDFEWSYPFRVPPAAAGPTPNLALSYSSGSTDGETISTNNQTSVVGEGWELAGTGFIERSFNGCSADGTGLSAEQTASGDLCWNGDNDTISFGGHSGVLVPTGTAGNYRVQGDDGSRVDYLPHSTTCADGGHDNGCWRLTTQDGTQYFFGRSATSAWTVPVFGDDTGEPCHAATFATSSCTQVWRWNLDFVQDVHGNTEQFLYHTETNYYHRDKGALVQYTRGGYLTEVDYGMRAGSSTVPQKVVLGYNTNGRCKTTTNCASETGPTYPTPAYPANYPDVPWDQNCVSGGACTGLIAPTFWTSQMLNTVTTSALVGSTMTTADVWTLTHTFDSPGDTSAASMWLASISHPGLPDTVFGGQFMNNRVWDDGAAYGDSLAPLAKRRMTTITTDTSGQLLIAYDQPDCTSVSTPNIALRDNIHQCFPQWWTPPGYAMQKDWLFKYRVKSVFQVPRTGGASDPSVETDYIYTGDPAWRFDQSAATVGSQRTWSVFAGYSSVEVRQGDSNSPATQQTTDYRFLQGMDGDPYGSDAHDPTSAHRNPPAITVGTHSVTDSLWWAGRTVETTVRIGSSGGGSQSTTPVLSDTITLPWASAATGTSSFSYSYTDPVDSTVYHGSFAAASYLTGDASSITTGTLSDGSTRTTTTNTSYDGYGRVTQVGSSTPDAGSTCTNTSYVTDTAGHTDTNLWLLNRPAQVSTVNVDCSVKVPDATNYVSGAQYFYDGAPSTSSAGNQTLTHGDLTETDAATAYSGTTATWTEQSHAVVADYDALGRNLRSYDANNHPTSTAYTPAGAGPVTSTTTSAVHTGASWGATTTAYSTLWGVPTSVTDQNGNLSTATYDSLGRLSQVWLPDRLQSTHATSPSISYAYKDTAGAALAVTTTTLNSSGATIASYAFMDGLGRPIQSQRAIDGTNPSSGSHQVTGTVITDTYYDAAGRPVLTDNPFGTPSVMPSTTLFNTATASQVPSQTQTSYDGAGRTTAVTQLGLNPATSMFGPLWSTTTSYLGVDRVNTTPPAGGTYTSTYTDSRGRTQYLDEYTTSSFSGAKERTSYGYDARGDMTAMTDPAGNHWSWTFDLLRRQTTAVDPDTGTTSTSYDPAGDITNTTDGDGHQLKYGYDDLNRKIAEYEWQPGPAGYAQIAGWSYDGATLGKGLADGSTTYLGSTPGTVGTANVVTAISAYNANGKPLATSLTVPAWAGSAGSAPYKWTYTYNQAGDQASVTDPATAGINAEKIVTNYDLLGQVATVGGYSSYLTNVTFTRTNQPAVMQITSGVTEVDRGYSYDDATARLTELRVTTSAATGYHLADHLYSYSNAGQLVRDSNTADGQGTDTQCYGYDGLQELQSAWTPASGDCSAAPSSSTLGGPAPYWSDYSYDAATGNRLSATSHAVTGGGVDQLTSYGYPAAGSAQPHGVSSVAGSSAPAGSGTYTATGSASYSYDAGGNTVVRPGQMLAWDSQNHLAGTTTSAGAGSNVYDADGNLILQVDPVAGSTLYLGDTELQVAAGSSTVSAVRTYSAYGMPIAERVTTAAAPSTVLQYWLDAGPAGQNTVDEQVRENSSLATTHRYFDPFGNARGTPVSWSNVNTFLNAPSDATTGTVHLGARDYDPVLGRFLSADPLLAAGNPLQVNGYSYASNDPVNKTDPTGLMQDNQQALTADCSHHQCTEAAINAGYSAGLSAGDAMPSYDAFVSQAYSGTPGGSWKDFGGGFFHGLASLADSAAPSCQVAGVCLGQRASNSYNGAFDVDTNTMAYEAGGAAAFVATWLAPELDLADVGDAVTAGKAARATRTAKTAETGGAGKLAGATCGGESFTPGTDIVMADGSAKPLDQVKVGDKVEATDIKTGKSTAQTVTTVWVNHDTDLMDVTVDSGGRTDVIHATQHHLFWDVIRKAWVEADQLAAGDQLRTDSGAVATVAATVVTPGAADMWDLTVNNAHDFYVVTTAATVLVHNCPAGPQSPKNFETPTNPAQAAPAQSDLPPGFKVRVMGPTSDYPTGYWRVTNAAGHYVDPSNMQQVGNVTKAQFNARTHVPLP